ncbi:MAG: response regulator [Chloroflexota bacterium]
MVRSNPVTLLLVDDEPMMIAVIEAMLEHLDCRVIKTMSPVEALDIYQQNQTEIDMVLVDQMMPRMTGLSLAEKLHEQNPNVKVILMTGSSVEDFEDRPNTVGVSGYLQKPFAFEDLEKALSKTLALQP